MTTKLELHIVRGLPGSGKTTYAKQLGIPVVEADQYFTDFKGRYIYEPTKIQDAHAWCQKHVKQYLSNNQSVAVANIFAMLWQIDIYMDIAKQYNAKVYIHECTGEYQNVHNVPKTAIDKMKEVWEQLPSWYQEYLVK